MQLKGRTLTVVNVLASNGWSSGSGVLGLADLTGVLELSALSLKAGLHVVIVAVVDLLVLDRSDVVGVLLWQNLTVLDRLDGGVVVVLVHLTVDGSLSLLVLGAGDVLLLDSWGNRLVDGGVVVSRLGHEGVNSLLSLVHCEVGCGW